MEHLQNSGDQSQLHPAANLGEAELVHLADLVPQMVWMCTPDGANIYFNQRWVDYTGMTLEESYGPGWNKPFHPDEQQISLQAWHRAVQTGTQYQVESRIRARDGSYRWFLMRGEPFKEADGHTVKWFGTCTDIHDMKLAEQALLQSEKLASVGRMAVSVSHEINNPLEAVTNLLYLAKNSEEISTIRSYLDDAEHELNRIAHITRQSLGFYRESSKASPSSIQQLLESAIDVMTAKITAKHACIETRWGNDVQLSVVAGELRQVFANLLANCLDAIPVRGTVKIRTSVGFDYQKKQQCFRVTMADNGQGIPRHLRSQIFEPLFTTKGAGSTGLGLWVSRQILEKHHATIRVRSRAEGIPSGTVIRITLPTESHTA
ncbi:MAG TPA: ATP-binding protein [Acidobacteriaceae bacterium]